MIEVSKLTIDVSNIGEVSDGSHTFSELYDHRMVLFAIICSQNKSNAWKSWCHNDGTMFNNYFIVGIKTPNGQFTYHYHKGYWEYFNVKTLDYAPKWDGHTAKDVRRLFSLLLK